MTKAELLQQVATLQAELAKKSNPTEEHPIAFVGTFHNKNGRKWMSCSKQTKTGYAKVTSPKHKGRNLVGFPHKNKANVVIFKWMPDNKS